MNGDMFRENPVEQDPSSELLSAMARDLPAGRHQFHKERLMAQIHEMRQEEQKETAQTPHVTPRRFRLPRPAIVLPALSVVLAGAVFAGLAASTGAQNEDGGVATGPVLTTQIGPASTEGVPRLLDQIALAAAATAPRAVKPGQYIYIESKTATTYVRTVDGKASVASDELHRRQVWESADGTKGWLIDPAVNDSPEGETLSLPDEQGNTPKAYLNNPSYDYLTQLPTDPDILLTKVYDETEGMGNSPDQQAFTTIGDLLGESYPPAELSAALFKAAAKIPGVVIVQDAVDAANRTGVAVARLDETSGRRDEWIFDPKNHDFLGRRTVQVRENTTGEDALIKPGTVVFTSAVIDRAIVDDIKSTPDRND
ncbi:CU044_5270 family protein [Streptomyces chilikensis]|uniref:CU044_5270 family protein n=1 Tax=Streptomyces chilikensis TaxID=1194079 RepID=UPI000A7B4562|nr:CU044_5270 family protein [Streptomyces chilikensis]